MKRFCQEGRGLFWDAHVSIHEGLIPVVIWTIYLHLSIYSHSDPNRNINHV